MRYLHAAIIIILLATQSCLLPVPTAHGYHVKRGLLHVIDADTEAEIPEVLVLAYTHHSGKPYKRMSNAFVYQSGDAFPMYRDTAVLIMGPCPQPVCATTSRGFIVIAKGYAPTFFPPEPRSQKEFKIFWRLRKTQPEDSRKSLDHVQQALTQDTFTFSQLKIRNHDDDVILTARESVQIALSNGERRLANTFIQKALD